MRLYATAIAAAAAEPFTPSTAVSAHAIAAAAIIAAAAAIAATDEVR